MSIEFHNKLEFQTHFAKKYVICNADRLVSHRVVSHRDVGGVKKASPLNMNLV